MQIIYLPASQECLVPLRLILGLNGLIQMRKKNSLQAQIEPRVVLILAGALPLRFGHSKLTSNGYLGIWTTE